MSTFDQILKELNQVEDAILSTCEQFVADATETVEAEAIKDSPAPGDIHIYATGNYRDSWARYQLERFRWRVQNEASKNGREYAQYTNEGYTRYGGPQSAQSYLFRQPPGSYVLLTELRLIPRLEVDLQRRLDLLETR